MGHLLLEGGAEFGGQMREPDLRAIELAGGFDAPIRILPTAAAPDQNHQRAGNNGIRWFQSLGARNVASLPLIDRVSANDAGIAQSLREARLIYMLGGFPHYLGQTLKGSLAWESVLEAYQNGAVIGGSSAGAMVMCEFYYDPYEGKTSEGLNLLPNSLVLPHHNTFGRSWAPRLLEHLPGVTLIGIDEQTGMLNDGEYHTWTVYGGGAITMYRGANVETYEAGKTFSLVL
ncbi:MAG TPA: Type 1 glutamine amidotransferase-like domain-containing protein [Anaerolineales bacterium]|nr:Type 1 glutamine amidotransferase-like domain-containing protein [Anaerolineales bacterium]